MPRRSRCAPALTALLLALGAARGAADVPPYRERVREHVLGNGLKLLLVEDHKAPVAVFQLWYRVGSRNERLGATGLSHLLEHMMFKGTDVVKPEEYSKIIQRNGGQTNAFTSHDYTTYFATLASDRLDVVIELEADRMANLRIDEGLYAPERDVVQEERRLRTDNDPVSALFEQLSAAAYTAHPYQWPIIGWMSDIAQSTADDLREHYRTYYAPNNAFIVAVGDFAAAALRETIADAFGVIPPGGLVPLVRGVEPRQQGERRVELQREAQLPAVALAYHVPNAYSPDAAALEVLAHILAGGKSARLHHELVYTRRLCRMAEASFDFLSHDPGLFTLYAQPLPGRSAAEVERALQAELRRLATHPPSARELEKARNGIEAEFVFAQDSLFYQGLLLGQFEITGDWRRIDAYLPAIRAVTAEDLVRVARVYFDADNRTVATLVPLPSTAPQAPPPGVPQGRVH